MTSSCMMMSSLIHCANYYLEFFVIEILYNLQNFGILQYYFYYIIQQLISVESGPVHLTGTIAKSVVEQRSVTVII